MLKSAVTVLVIDDDSGVRSVLRDILKREGYQSQTADDINIARRVIKSEKIDLVVADQKALGQNSYHLLKEIKAEHPGIGVIIMTAHGDSDTLKDGLLLGADEYIIKPFRSIEVKMVIERAYLRLLSANGKAETEAD